ncbi:hypothetical protein CU098_004663 [Rhizopus stolonifer]|uniref:Cytochrome P450-dit2 n=1 Tax=Rhizopus stolonifer TaxID=4846 RepID=A0A367J2J0_RHIST|nr:hypothetical protein CU098_004663 [Rhizopus stolonifer]
MHLETQQLYTLYEILTRYYAKHGSVLKTACKLTIVSLIVYKGIQKLYDAYLGPLRHIPGPFICKFMNIPSFVYDMPIGTMFKSMKQLHDKYGSLVRIGPNHVSISDKNMMKHILLSDDVVKGPAYALSRVKGENSFNTENKSFHKRIRRLASPAFSNRYISSLDPLFLGVIQSLIDQLDQEIQSTEDKDGFGTVDVWKQIQYLSLDIIGETAFGQSFNMVHGQSHFVASAILKKMRVASVIIAYPFLIYLTPLMQKYNQKLVAFAHGIFSARKQSGTKRNDILQVLIDTQDAENPEDRLSVQAIASEIYLYLVAGSETTSNTIGFTIIELLRHPDKMAKLMEELNALPIREGQTTYEHEQLKHLSYLNAVIQETMRINPVNAAGLQRRLTKQMTWDQVVFPGNTIVTCCIYHAHRNDTYWPNATQFVPERWIPGEKEYTSNEHDAFFGFSIGSRNCIGKQFAMHEMRLTIANLLKLYTLKPITDELSHAKDTRQYLTLSVAQSRFLTKIKRK